MHIYLYYNISDTVDSIGGWAGKRAGHDQIKLVFGFDVSCSQ